MPIPTTAAEWSRRLSSREISAVELATDYLQRIRDIDAKVDGFLTVSEEEALDQARHAQNLLDRGEGGPLTGLPLALKDNISTKGIRTTCASRLLANYVPVYDATVVERLKQRGLVILGKTNLDEFAMGTSTEHSAFHVTRNPWDLSRSPGGSSGGSAAAVAADLAPLALGSDTGGSIRQPAAMCGIVGFKPTYGRCSRYGLIAFASSLDQIGPLARSVEDAALLAEVVTGHDERDGTSLRLPAVSTARLKERRLRGLKLAVPRELTGEGVAKGVREVFCSAQETLRREGAEISEVSLPSLKLGVTTYYIIAPAEASSNLARFDGVRYGLRCDASGQIEMMERTRAQGFGHEVKTRIMVGTYALSAGYYDAYYLRAQQVRTLMRLEIEKTLNDFDLIISPTSPVAAFPLGSLTEDPLALKLLDLCTIPANLAGLPAISLNCGVHDGLPVGLQLMAPAREDERLLQLAYAIERALPPIETYPSLH